MLAKEKSDRQYFYLIKSHTGIFPDTKLEWDIAAKYGGMWQVCTRRFETLAKDTSAPKTLPLKLDPSKPLTDPPIYVLTDIHTSPTNIYVYAYMVIIVISLSIDIHVYTYFFTHT